MRLRVGSIAGRRMRRALSRMKRRLVQRPYGFSGFPQNGNYRLLVVCLGNYCRSPVAEGVLRSKLKELGLEAAITVESAGTSTYYEGSSPHKYAREEARRRGIDIERHRARGLDQVDLTSYELVVAVDERTRSELPVDPERLVLLGNFGEGGDIADPNGGDAELFAQTHDAIDAACAGLAEFVADRFARSTRSGT
jgi:protein-tyrosine phosphatase